MVADSSSRLCAGHSAWGGLMDFKSIYVCERCIQLIEISDITKFLNYHVVELQSKVDKDRKPLGCFICNGAVSHSLFWFEVNS